MLALPAAHSPRAPSVSAQWRASARQETLTCCPREKLTSGPVGKWIWHRLTSHGGGGARRNSGTSDSRSDGWGLESLCPPLVLRNWGPMQESTRAFCAQTPWLYIRLRKLFCMRVLVQMFVRAQLACRRLYMRRHVRLQMQSSLARGWAQGEPPAGFQSATSVLLSECSAN